MFEYTIDQANLLEGQTEKNPKRAMSKTLRTCQTSGRFFRFKIAKMMARTFHGLHERRYMTKARNLNQRISSTLLNTEGIFDRRLWK